MNLIRFVIQRKVFVSMLFIGLSLLGYISYQQLPVELLPNTELPFLMVQVRGHQEMDPAYLEKGAVVPLEGVISTLEGIDRLESYIDRRSGRIMVYFNQDVRIKYVHLKLQEKVNEILPSLGDEFMVMVLKVDIEQLANTFMQLQARGGGGINRVRNLVDQKALRELENIDGVAHVEVIGGQQTSIEIRLNEEACRAHNITASQIRAILAGNARDKTFVGQVYQRKQKLFVNVVAEYSDVSQLENIVLRAEGPLLLKHVAHVYGGLKEQTTISRVNGKEAVSVQMVRDNQVNLIDVSHRTRDVIEQLNEKLKSEDLEIVIQYDSAENIEKNVDLVKQLALIGGLLAVVVLWVFLRNLRLVLVIAFTIPASVLIAFNLFYLFDISINSLTLVGMALAIGMLVDNSVVVLENIYRLLSSGVDEDEAVIRGTQEVWKSIFASTMTTITVFLPFLFSSNFLIKVLGHHIGISIVSTLLVSLIFALLIIPMITHWLMLRRSRGGGMQFSRISTKNRLIQLYTVFLKSAIRFPARTIVGAALAFFASLLICLGLSLNTPEESRQDQFTLYITMPAGATLETTSLAVTDLEGLFQDFPEAQDIASQIYEEEATITIQLKEDYEKIRQYDLARIKNEIQERMDRFRTATVGFDPPAASRRFSGGGGGMGGGRSMNQGMERMLGIGSQEEKVVVKGSDFTIMRQMAEEISTYLQELSSMRRVSLSVADDRPEIHVYSDNFLLSEYGINANAVSAELASFQSEYTTTLKYKQGVDEYDIVIRNEVLEEKDIDDLRTLRIPGDGGGLYELQDISRIIYTQGVTGISRVNQEKQIEITYGFYPEITSDKTMLELARGEVDQVVASLRLPQGLAVEVVHDDLDLSEFYFLLAAAFILIYMILASVFESLLTPVVMLFTLPLAAIGALWGLIFTGHSILNANTMIGFLILLGVVVNNGVIFIDFTNILRGRGYNRSRALLMAGRARVRPILITSLTTIIGMLPLAMGKAEYVTQIGSPFAITVIGGLSLSTLFTLVFIPTVYSGLESALAWLKKLPWYIKAAQALLFIAGSLLIYFNVDSFIWQMVDLFVLLLAIPALTYFIQISLRQARAEYIKPNEAITITIQHMVKIYDQDSRFVREWKKDLNGRGQAPELKSKRYLLEPLIWQVPVLLFLLYFTYGYLSGKFWTFVLMHFVFFYIRYFWRSMQSLLRRSFPWMRNEKRQRWIETGFLWGLPLMNAWFFYFKWNAAGLGIFVAILWYILLVIATTSHRLHRDRVNIARIEGRFSGMRRAFYRFVHIIPIVGRRKSPFRALDNVSVQIGSGMFGLLGPNGAGKTTLMRIICGVLEQTRGSIWINGIALKEKREELQGLIGYLPQEFGTYENMTAYEFLSYQAILKGITDKEKREKIIDYVLAAVHLQESRHKRIDSFSGGMKQRIGIAQTLLHLPRILVVDEPTAGLDPRERIRFRNLLVELSRERIVIFSTHIIEDISSSCNQVAVLNRGRLVYLGEPGHMAETARGVMWQILLSPQEFDQFRKDHRIVH
ncbi:efflux RND transporter permease subunit, partial [candidate division KSB1 bacterium]|nr:efflux RND transporter permease subunit [candidate division KSB1 bacterium]